MKDNLKEAVCSYVCACDLGATFDEIVANARSRGLDPTLRDMQEVLRTLVFGRGWKELVLEAARDGIRFFDRELVGPGEDGLYELRHEGITYAFGFDFGPIWRAACTDFFGDSRGRKVFLKKQGEPERVVAVRAGDGCHAPEFPAHQGRIRNPRPRMELEEADYVRGELAAIRDALDCSLSKEVYEELRREGKQIKLSFSVEVDLDDNAVEATMSGNIKRKNNAVVSIPDARQLELDLR